MRHPWWFGVGLWSCSPLAPTTTPTPEPPVTLPVGEALGPDVQVPPDEPLCRLAAAEQTPTRVDPDAAPVHGRMTVRRDGALLALPLVRESVDTRVLGPVAETTLRQVFNNSYDVPVEAVYALPVAEGGAVDVFRLRAGSLTVQGEVREIEAAREIYSAQNTPRIEPGWPNVFMQGIPAVPPGAVVEVEVHLVHAPRIVDGGYELVVPAAVGVRPFVAAAAAGAPVEAQRSPLACPELDLTVTIRGGHAPEQLRSKYHRVRVNRSDDLTVVRLAGGGDVANRDLVLGWRTAGSEPRATLLSQRDRDGGVFALMIQPPLAIKDDRLRAREVVFVLDTSSRMHGWRLDLARRAIFNDLATMRPGDAYQIVDLHAEAAALAPGLVPADAEGRLRGETYLAAHVPAAAAAPFSGLRHALGLPRDPSRIRQVLLFTPGVAYDADLLGELRPHIGDARVHGFDLGVGSPSRFLEVLARISRGEVIHQEFESGAEAVLRHADRLSRPVLTDLDIDWAGLAVADVVAVPLADVTAGHALVVVGRFNGTPGQVRVRGKFGGAELDLPVAVAATDSGTGLVTRWAQGRIDELQRSSGTEEAVRALAVRHRVVTPSTLLIATGEQTVSGADGQPRTEALALVGSVDRDHDAIPDFVDKCPEVPENVNGHEDADGCPEALMNRGRVPVGVIKGVHFDERVATIKAKSRPALDRAVEILKEFTTMRIEISGHMDATEQAPIGLKRAEAVRAYLVKRGVAADRIEVRDAGPEDPIDTNKTGPGRAKNRRIEFTILVR